MKSWITFAGEGRSGHTIVSAILGSHPNIRMAEEQKYISKWYREKWSKQQIIDGVLSTGVGKARKLLNFPNILTHEDPLIAIGDKCGWDAVNEVAKRSAPVNIYDDFSKHMEMSVKIIVTLRNPLDNIATWCLSPKYERMYSDKDLRCRRMIRRYKRFYECVERIIKNQDVFLLHHEELVYNKTETLKGLCSWLEISCDDNWLKMCRDKIFNRPNKKEFDWPEGYIEERLEPFIQTNSLMKYYREGERNK